MNTDHILITGASGFLGHHVIDAAKKRNPRFLSMPSHEAWDLLDENLACGLIENYQPSHVIHLAATVGGIGANQKRPADFFYENMQMGMNIIRACAAYGVDKLLIVGTVCSYPKLTPSPFREDNLWNGYPEETNAPYGIAKKALLTMAQAYREQYGLNVIFVMPTNLYGEYDNFDPDTSHVIPALILKCLNAIKEKAEFVELWGTGTATRDFLYAGDAAKGLIDALYSYNSPEPMNFGSGEEISILELVKAVATITGFQGAFHFDATKPDGQPRRLLDISRARKEIDFRPSVRLEDGLRKTIEWYKGANHD